MPRRQITTLPDMAKLRKLPMPPADALPPAWDDMNGTERAFFIYRWRVEHGHLIRPADGDAEQMLLDAGFTLTRFPRDEAA